jgi:Flagellin hook IN motif
VSIQGLSFYQQNQNYWQQQQAWSQAQSADNALISVMGQAEVNQAKGLASIANGTALARVKSQLVTGIQSLLQGSNSNSTSSSAPTKAQPATAVGTVPLTRDTSLSTLGFLPGGTFSVDAGTNITQYTSTGDDTVADLINAINSGPAFVTASINGSGKLVITSRDTKDIITIQGSGTDAVALGFGPNNDSFTATQPKPAASSSSSTSGTASTGKSSSSTAKSSGSGATVASVGMETASSAASILSASGASGSLVDMLA